MSDFVPTDITIPAHLANVVGEPSKLSAALRGGLSESVGYPQISINDARFCIYEHGAKTVLDDLTLAVVIVGANSRLSKAYHAEPQQTYIGSPSPDCYSLDGIRPVADIASPKNDNCAGCPMNAWGSRTTPLGRQIKACADNKRLAVVAANDLAGPVYLLQVTLASLVKLISYQKELSQKGIPLEAVNTIISFDYDDTGDPTLIFRFDRFLEENEYNISKELVGSEKVKGVTIEKFAAEPLVSPHRDQKGTFIPTSETNLFLEGAPWDLSELSEAGQDLADYPNGLTAAQWLMKNYEPHKVISTYYSRVIDATRNINILADSSTRLIEELGAILEARGFFQGLELKLDDLFANRFLEIKALIEEIGCMASHDGQSSFRGRGKHIEDSYDAFEALDRVFSLSKKLEKTLLETLEALIIDMNDLERQMHENLASILDDLMLASSGIAGISYYFSMANDLHEEKDDCIDKVMMVPDETLLEPLAEGQISQDDDKYREILEKLQSRAIDWSEAAKALEKLISWPKDRWEA